MDPRFGLSDEALAAIHAQRLANLETARQRGRLVEVWESRSEPGGLFPERSRYGELWAAAFRRYGFTVDDVRTRRPLVDQVVLFRGVRGATPGQSWATHPGAAAVYALNLFPETGHLGRGHIWTLTVRPCALLAELRYQNGVLGRWCEFVVEPAATADAIRLPADLERRLIDRAAALYSPGSELERSFEMKPEPLPARHLLRRPALPLVQSHHAAPVALLDGCRLAAGARAAGTPLVPTSCPHSRPTSCDRAASSQIETAGQGQ